MKNITKSILSVALFAGLFAAACGDDGGETTGSGAAGPGPGPGPTTGGGGVGGEAGAGQGGGGGPVIPPPPKVGKQLERMGRAGINTATSDVFVDTSVMPPKAATAASYAAAEDAYNAAGPADWAKFAPSIAVSLSILDALDAPDNVDPKLAGCGNQAAAGLANGMKPLDKGAYDGLAGILADDRIWVDTTKTQCDLYLAVEFGVLGVATPNCGGRKPSHDSIDITYSAVANVALAVAEATMNKGFGDTIEAPDHAKKDGAFPYLDKPHTP
jgi:hypothetical protein